MEANRYFLRKSTLGRVLILGGGDGTDYLGLEEKLSGAYWEKSEAMLRLARKNLEKADLTFHLGGFSGGGKYDVICLPFLLDSFLEEEIDDFLKKIQSNLTEKGMVVFSDFFPPDSTWQKVLLRIMLLAHRFLVAYGRKDLPNYAWFFEKNGWVLVSEKTWSRGWIRTQRYQVKSKASPSFSHNEQKSPAKWIDSADKLGGVPR